MNQSTATDSNDHNVVDLAESPGRRLRVQRQSRGMEIERIATQLHLRNDVVEALEQDRYDALPAPVYVAGYLRNYARLVGLDPTSIVNAYHGATPHADARMTQPMPSRRPRPKGRSGGLLVRLITLAIVGVVFGMLVLWWQSRAELTPDRLGPFVVTLWSDPDRGGWPDGDAFSRRRQSA